MTRPASYSCDVYLLTAITNGNAIVPSLDAGVNNVDPSWTTNVDSICVGTISGRGDGNVLEREIFAAQNIHMELFAVKGSYVLDYAIGDKVEPYVLFISNTVDRINVSI